MTTDDDENVLEKLKQEVYELESDITFITQDIKSNLKEEQQLTHEINNIRKIENIQHQQHNNINAPHIIRHNYFDSSIQQYFDTNIDEPEVPREKPNYSNFNSIDKLDLRENILYENIFRMIGITAFPINKRDLPNGTNEDIIDPNLLPQNRNVASISDELLGIRFDIYSSHSKTFKTPHYIILRKIMNKDFTLNKYYSIYKDTIPLYIHLKDHEDVLQNNKHSEIDNLSKFTYLVYEKLIKVQYKFDKFDSLMQFNKIKGNNVLITSINKDLVCERVTINLQFKNGNKRKNSRFKEEIELMCSFDSIEVVKFINFNDEFKDRLILSRTILQNSKITDLNKNFRKVFELINESKENYKDAIEQ
ncbi:unnamed protein product [Candida verbasci]|uniref:Central kinetochore subunit MCM21 n=1 Tax=Candida verbasci TaxID=1227364 RepID=A0A9W4U1Q4_9ASCO|nr:unnamed protein product [Candida verbasci]